MNMFDHINAIFFSFIVIIHSRNDCEDVVTMATTRLSEAKKFK